MKKSSPFGHLRGVDAFAADEVVELLVAGITERHCSRAGWRGCGACTSTEPSDPLSALGLPAKPASSGSARRSHPREARLPNEGAHGGNRVSPVKRAEPAFGRLGDASGGGENRTPVRGRTGQSVYRFSSRLEFRPDGRLVSGLPPG